VYAIDDTLVDARDVLLATLEYETSAHYQVARQNVPSRTDSYAKERVHLMD
jgi:hypothetical protein